MLNKDTNKVKPPRGGVAGILWRALEKREATAQVITITFDEFRTSIKCDKCQTLTFQVTRVHVCTCSPCRTLV